MILRWLILIVSFVWGSAVYAEGFKLVIPTGPGWQSVYQNNARCQRFLGTDPLTVFGIEARHAHPQSYGLTVQSVFANSPADGVVQPGDLLISMNGDAFVRTERREHAPFDGIWDGYNFQRGIYLFGYRQDQIVEFVLFPCGQTETVYPFRSQQLFGSLYNSIGTGVDLPASLLIAGVSRGKAASSGPISGYMDNRYELFDSYCWVRKSTKISVVRTTGQILRSGSVLNERQSTYSYNVDLLLYPAIAKDFDFTHNKVRIVMRDVERSVISLIDRIGCATPEWKGFEKLVYKAAGLEWDNAPYRYIDWSKSSNAPPR